MPSGRVHATTTLIASVGLLAGAPIYAGQLGAASLMLPAGCLSGLLLSPDLDVDRGNISFHYAEKFGGMIGDLTRFAWRVFWYPYAKLVRHRSWISHGCLVSTALRVAYLMIGSLCIFVAYPAIISPWFLYWFLGLAVSDGLHIIMDKIF